MFVAVFAVILGVCSAEITALGSTETTRAQTATQKTVPGNNICGMCTCLNKKISCSASKKITDLQNIHVPANFNILDLSSSQLLSIKEDSFVEAPDVTELNLGYNHIGYLAAKGFVAFKNLTSLCLLHNNLVTLEDDSFFGLDKLEKLDLSGNRFRRLNPEYLSQLVNLKYLVLNENKLDGLHGSIFRNNTKLSQLYMNKIGIDRLDDDLFHYTRDLRILHVEDNFLEEIPKVALSKLPLLELLSLSGNPIHIISAMAFPKMPNLQRIFLTSMYNLQKIEIYAFTDLPMLRDLKIQHCGNLMFIDPQAFNQEINSEKPKYPHVKNFVLHDTAVTTLSEKLLSWEDLNDLDISGNPFHCNCNLSWIVPFVRTHKVNENIRCHTPEALKDHVIGRLAPQKMLCDNYDPLKDSDDDSEIFKKSSDAKSRRFSVMHFIIVLMLSVTVVLSILLILSLKRRGFLYKKLGKPTPMTYAGGENVLYMRTTIDNY